jgi:hypothetical protein
MKRKRNQKKCEKEATTMDWLKAQNSVWPISVLAEIQGRQHPNMSQSQKYYCLGKFSQFV